jgi:hypothetical protein
MVLGLVPNPLISDWVREKKIIILLVVDNLSVLASMLISSEGQAPYDAQSP